MILYTMHFYQVFYNPLIDNGIVIISRGKFLAPKWYYSINNTKIVIYLDKINKTPLNININKISLK